MSDVAHYAAVFFHEYIAEKFKAKPDVYNFLLRHERKQACLAAICRQVTLAEISNLRHKMDMGRVKALVEVAAQMFCAAALQHAEESILSSAEVNRLVEASKRVQRAQESLIDTDIIHTKETR